MASTSLKVVVVTPERAVLDEPADMAVLPLYDGELGVQPGHSAFVGQLGPGELRLKSGAGTKRFFIDGGFAQVRADVVNVLTAKATPVEELSLAQGEQALAAADALPTANPVERTTRTKAQETARSMIRVAARK